MTTGLAGAALVAMSLSGCGQSNETFCSTFQELGSADTQDLDNLRDNLSTLQDNAPDEISSQVDTYAQESEKIVDSLDAAGINPDDLRNTPLDELAGGLSEENQRRFADALGTVDQEAAASAGQEVQSWVDDNCAA